MMRHLSVTMDTKYKILSDGDVVNTCVVKEVFRESQHTREDAADEQTQKASPDEKEGAARVQDEQKQLSHYHSDLQEQPSPLEEYPNIRS